jgi:NAD(P)-dependent dehydrogenase (short-subunit alcohol dehydrogenase family)
MAASHVGAAVIGLVIIAAPQFRLGPFGFFVASQAVASYLALRSLCLFTRLPSPPHGVERALAWMSMVCPAVAGSVLASCAVAGVAYLAQFPVWRLSALLSRWFPRRSFRGLHVLIAGGGTGLGKAMGALFAAEGARVTLISRNEQHLQEACREIGGVCQWVVCDVTDAEAVSRAVAEATARFGGDSPDVVVTSAGLARPGSFCDTPLSVFRSQMELNYFGTLHVLRACVPAMLRRRSGTVAIVGSALALMGSPDYCQYVPSKWAVRGLAESLRYELLPQGVSVHLICPSNMDTPGLAEESKTKTPQAALMEGRTDMVPPAVVASLCVEAIRRGDYLITNTEDIEYVRMSSNSTAPSPRPICDFLMAPIWIIGIGIQRMLWERRLSKLHQESSKGK